MISPISFTSTYKVDNKNKSAFEKFQKFALDSELMDGVTAFLDDEISSEYPYDYKAEQTLIVPDYDDDFVESFCANNNIKFKKLKTEDLLNPKMIKKRIKEAPIGHKKVEINSKQLEHLVKNQRSNLKACEDEYIEYFRRNVDTVLRHGVPFYTTTVYIDTVNKNDDLKEYVERYGVKNLNPGQITVDFCQQNDDFDQCMYFALKDLGVENIPVYVDHCSYETGKILGLF